MVKVKKSIYINLIIILCVFILLYIILNYNLSNKSIQNFSEDNLDKINSNISSLNKDNLDELNIMKETHVIFGGPLRNVEKYLQKNLDNIDKCGSLFASYALILYENDSTDNTRDIMIKNKKDNYYYIFEDKVKEPSRTARLANGHNLILNKAREINKNNLNKYIYLILLDMDDVNNSGMFIDTIHTCFKYKNWSAMFPTQTDKYYDIWALRIKDTFDYDCWAKKNIHLLENSKKEQKYYEPGQLIEVISAFGGAGIYRLESIPDKCKYIGKYYDNNEVCEHVPFNICISESGGKLYINTSFITGDAPLEHIIKEYNFFYSIISGIL